MSPARSRSGPISTCSAACRADRRTPFSPREVVARAAAILRRTGRAAAPSSAEGPARLTAGQLAIDTESWSARWQGQDVTLTPTEFSLLHALMAAPTRFFTRDQLIDRLHGPGFAVTDRTIDSHVRNLRRKFAELGCDDLIETRSGIGYRLGPCQRSPSGG